MPCDRRLRRQERICEQYEYKKVISTGRVLDGKRFRAYLLIDGVRASRAGFVAGKAVGNACQRNRARRLMREAYRCLKPHAQRKHFEVIFVARRSIAAAGLGDVAADMRKMLDSLNLLGAEG